MGAAISAMTASTMAMNTMAINNSGISPEIKLAFCIVSLLIIVFGLIFIWYDEFLPLKNKKQNKQPKIDKKAWKKYIKTTEKLSKSKK